MRFNLHESLAWYSVATVMMVIVIVALLITNPAAMPTSTVLANYPGKSGQIPFDPKHFDPAKHIRQAQLKELETRFQQAVTMLETGHYEYAIAALDRVIEISPSMSEAYVNKGFAYIGLEQYEAARDNFDKATDLNPYQGNAYWGLAVAYEKMGDLETSLGAMRSFLHLTPKDNPFVRRARSALWEWETELTRGPLPEAEAEWIARRTKEMEDINRPESADNKQAGRDPHGRIPIKIN